METDTLVPTEITALRAHRFLLRASLALGGMFAWIFSLDYLYEIAGDVPRAIAGTALLYVLSQVITIVLTPVAAMHLRRGVRQSLVWAVVALGSAFVFLGATIADAFGTETTGWGIACFAVLMGVYRALYWVPYHVQCAELPHTRFRMHVLFEGVLALMPLFVGMTIGMVAYPIERILFGAAGLAGASIVPLFALADTREKFSWSLSYTYAQLCRQKNRLLVARSLMAGVEGAGLFYVWPIAAFIVLGYSYGGLGIVCSVSLVCVLVLRHAYRWMTHRYNLHTAPVFQTVAVTAGWVGRSVAGTPIGLIIADVLSYTTIPSHGIVSDPFVFEQSSDRGTFLDEYTAIKEMSLAGGRIICATLLGTLVLVIPLAYALAFVLACATLASVLSLLAARHV